MTVPTTTWLPDVAALGHAEAMVLAGTEYDRLLALVDDLGDADWTRPTDCAGWDVRAVVGHLLGMFEINADRGEAARQFALAGETAQRDGGLRIDALTALQVREHAHLSTGDLVAALHATAPKAFAGRRDSTEEERAAPYPTGIPGEDHWTRGYLLDVILTRDTWMHRVDICRATGREPVLTADHDGRLVADVVADWARRHGQPLRLVLDGPAGGSYAHRGGGEAVRLDAVEFCRILSGRGVGGGLLAVRVPF